MHFFSTTTTLFIYMYYYLYVFITTFLKLILHTFHDKFVNRAERVLNSMAVNNSRMVLIFLVTVRVVGVVHGVAIKSGAAGRVVRVDLDITLALLGDEGD